MFKLDKTRLNILKAWLPLAVVITCLSGLIYLTVQQNIRISANDPQIQIVEDISAQLGQGQNPQYFIPSTKTELSKSLATYIMIFNKEGKLIGSSVTLFGKDPILPQGVFTSVQKTPTGESRFTWQPQSGIRSAVVLDYYKGPTPGFVLIGRSIREVEVRESQEELIVLAGWAATIIISFLTIFVLSKIK